MIWLDCGPDFQLPLRISKKALKLSCGHRWRGRRRDKVRRQFPDFPGRMVKRPRLPDVRTERVKSDIRGASARGTRC